MNKHSLYKVICTFTLMLIVSQVSADVIVTTTGTRFEGEIVNETSDSVIIDYDGVKNMVDKKKIVDIKKDTQAFKKSALVKESAQVSVKKQETEIIDISQIVERKMASSLENNPKAFKRTNQDFSLNQAQSIDEVQSFIKNVLMIDQDFNRFFQEYQALNKPDGEVNGQAVIDAHLDVIRYIEDAKVKIKELTINDVTRPLQESMLEYYEQLMKFHTVSLQQIANPGARKDMNEFVEKFEFYENDFYKKLEELLSSYKPVDIVSPKELPAASEITDITSEDATLEDLNRIREEYHFYLSQIKELVQVNEALKIQTQQLMKRNYILQEQLQEIVEASLAYMSLPQKKALLQYLNSDQ